MKKTIFCATALAILAFASNSFAADLPARRSAQAYVPPAFTWTGFYAGVNAGYAFGMDKIKNPDVIFHGETIYPLDTEKSSSEGSFTGGVQAGYNYQMGSFVIGAEADFNYAGLKTKYDGRSDFLALQGLIYGDIPGADVVTAKSKLEWFGTVRARAGFTPVDRLLVYVTGGLAYGQVKSSMTYTDYFWGEVDGQGHISKSDTRIGWTVGAGVEYAITNNLTLRGEYAYVDLGDKTHRRTFSTPNIFGPDFHSMSFKESANFQVVRAGLNYKF